MWQLHAACNLWGNLSISVTSFEIFDNNCCRTWNSGRVNLVTWRLSLTNSCKKSLINICNKILINSCNESLTNRCNTSLIQIASFHSILLASSPPGVEMINAFANWALAGLINFCLKRMKYDLGGAPQNLISKYRFWISTSGKYWVSFNETFLVP